MQEIKLHVATWGSHCLPCASENDTQAAAWHFAASNINMCKWYWHLARVTSHHRTWHSSRPVNHRGIVFFVWTLTRLPPPKWLRVHFCDRNLKCVYVLMSVAMHVCDWVYTYMYIQYRIEANAASLSPHQVSFSKQTSLHLRSHPYLLPLNK